MMMMILVANLESVPPLGWLPLGGHFTLLSLQPALPDGGRWSTLPNWPSHLIGIWAIWHLLVEELFYKYWPGMVMLEFIWTHFFMARNQFQNQETRYKLPYYPLRQILCCKQQKWVTLGHWQVLKAILDKCPKSNPDIALHCLRVPSLMSQWPLSILQSVAGLTNPTHLLPSAH